MSNFMNFFFSFEKLMKEKLVIAFFWLALIKYSLNFVGNMLDKIGLDPLDWLTDFAAFFVEFLMVVVIIRLLSEVAIAVFRINDNLSPDGGKSETADIDPIEEALKAARAAEEAAKKATASAKSAIVRTKSDTDTPTTAKSDENPEVKPEPASEPLKAAPAKKTTTKKPAAKKTTATSKKPATKKPAAKSSAPKKGPTLNKDGTPRKKRTPKPKTD